MVARVRRVDGEERASRASPRGALMSGRAGGVRLGEHLVRKDVRDLVLVQRDQADGLLARHVADPLDHARRRQAEAASLA